MNFCLQNCHKQHLETEKVQLMQQEIARKLTKGWE